MSAFILAFKRMMTLKPAKDLALLCLWLLLLPTCKSVQAQFTYTTNADNTLTITGYTGRDSAVTIPTNINELMVTGIGMGAFIDNANITSVTIPVTVTSPGYAAFQGCGMLTNVIMYGLTSIADYMFSDCTHLTNAPIPPSVTTIGYEAFYDTAFATISIPSNVTTIGNGAFAGCTAVTNVLLYGVVALGYDAFDYCTSLRTVTISATIGEIIGNPFDDCPRLTSVFFLGNFPDDVSYIPGSGWPFGDNPGLTVFCMPGTSNWSFLTEHTGIIPVLWNPVIQTGKGTFGVQNNQFGFDIKGTAGIPIVVEGCTNLANPVWTALTNVTLTNGLFHFREPTQANSAGRFYRIGSP